MSRKEPKAIVLVHGLWMHGAVLSVYRHRFAQSGFLVRVFSYPTVRSGLDANSHALSCFVSEVDSTSICLLGHSLGGLVILDMLAKRHDPRIQRVVLMGTPCKGSHSASVLLSIPALSWLAGHSIRDAQRRADWTIPEHVALGVLAGTHSVGFGRLIPGLPFPNDGTVSVAETLVNGCRDAITLPVSHSGMLFSHACADQVIHFLNFGHFFHA